MAESTAGIGEAAALINRANAPSGMDITRGIQMAENSALKRAQADAAKAAKADAKAAAMAKMSRVNTGKYKNIGVAKEAEKSAYDLMSKKAIALENGDYVSSAKLDIEADYLGNYLASKDDAISTLKSPKKYEYANKAGELINSGKEDEAAKLNKAYAPVFVRGEMGDYIVEVPDAVDLNKVYSNVLKSAFRNEISFASLKDAATDTENYSIKRKMTPEEVAMVSGGLLRDEGYVKSVLYNPDFQKFYDKKYAGSADPSSLETGLYDYTQERIESINQEKVSVKTKGKGGGAFKLTESGFSIGDYNFSVIPTTAANFVQEAEGNGTMYGRDEVLNSKIMERNKLAGNTPVTKVAMPYDSKSAFIVSDPFLGRVETGKPVSLIQGGGKTYLVYLTKINNRERTQIVEMTPTILSQMATYYKTDPKTFIKAYGSSGVDLKKYAPAGNINTSKKSEGSTKKPEPAKTITSAQYRAMSVAERKDFKEKGGIVK
jgi:hypothetical protein